MFFATSIQVLLMSVFFSRGFKYRTGRTHHGITLDIFSGSKVLHSRIFATMEELMNYCLKHSQARVILNGCEKIAAYPLDD